MVSVLVQTTLTYHFPSLLLFLFGQPTLHFHNYPAISPLEPSAPPSSLPLPAHLPPGSPLSLWGIVRSVVGVTPGPGKKQGL